MRAGAVQPSSVSDTATRMLHGACVSGNAPTDPHHQHAPNLVALELRQPEDDPPSHSGSPRRGAVVACRDGFFLVGMIFVAALLLALLMARGGTKR